MVVLENRWGVARRMGMGRGIVWLLGAGSLAAGAQACSSATGPEIARDARIVVEGTAPNPLRLIVSTDFVEFFDDVNQEFLVGFNSADTSAVTIPMDETLPVPAPGNILVRLTQLDTLPAMVRMRVLINGSPQYDQTATLADEGTIEFRFFSR